MIDAVFNLSEAIRYIAVYRDGHLTIQQKAGLHEASAAESDRYEELLVNPTLLKLVSQRGNIDCGGLNYVLIRYGSFFQFVLPCSWGHVSVSIETTADPVQLGQQILAVMAREDRPASA